MSAASPLPLRRALVTGGTGFVGAALARRLADEGVEVVVASRSATARDADPRVRAVAMDLADPASVSAAVAAVGGCDTVFHVAARTGVWGSRESFFRPNVTGTRHVLAACREHGVARLVHTSSPSVCFDGRDHLRASNDLPYPERFESPYPETKAIAEREVLAAHGTATASGTLATCALRPHLVIGPGDPHLFPRLVERARAGRLPIVGDGANEVSVTDVRNAAAAHLAAACALAPDAACGGRAYFVAQEEPVQLWPWLAEVFGRLGVPAPRRRMSLRTARALGTVCEGLWRLLRRADDPPMTRFVASQLATSHSYDMEPARRDLGYVEEVTLREATERVVRSLESA